MISRAELEKWCDEYLPGGKWEKSGEYIVSSPFRVDNNPSFAVNLDKRCYRDRARGGVEGRLSDLCARLNIPEPGREERKNTAAGPDFDAIVRNGEAKRIADKSAEAKRLWDSASPATAGHPYLAAKGIGGDGLRQTTGGVLLVPAYSIQTGELAGVERIDLSGQPQKKHLGAKSGTFSPRGDMNADGPLLLAEGIATAASLHELTGWTAVSCFGVPQLVSAAQLLKKGYPHKNIIIAPDADNAGEKAGADCRAAGFKVVMLPDGSPKGHDWNDVFCEQGIDSAREAFRDAWQSAQEHREEERAKEPARGFSVTLLHGSELVYRPREHLVKGLIMPNSLSVIYGPPGGAKTFFCLDMALSIASGQAFLGRRTKEGPTIYVGAEGADEVAKRLEAWDEEKAAAGVSYKNVPFYYVPHAVTIPQAEHRDALVEAVLERVEGELDGVAPVAVYLDTLARCSDGDENSNSDMSVFIAAADELRARLNGCAVVLVHHTPKHDPETLRGASALHGAVDTALCLLPVGAGTEQEQELALRVKKQKDLPQGRDEYLARVQVELPFEDFYGDAATSCIIEAREGRSEADKPLKGNSKAAFDALFAAAREHGVRLIDGKGAGVHIEAWRECFYRVSTADNPDTKRKAFGRARDDLRDKGIVEVSDDVYVPLRDADRVLLNSARMERLTGGENSPKDSGTSGTKAGHVPLCPARNLTEAGQDGTLSLGVSRCPAQVVPDGEGKKEKPLSALPEERAVEIPSPRGKKILLASDVRLPDAIRWARNQPGLLKRLGEEAKEKADGGMVDAGDYLNTAVKCEYADWLNSEAAASTSQGADMEPAAPVREAGAVSSLADEASGVSVRALAERADVPVEAVQEGVLPWVKVGRLAVTDGTVRIIEGAELRYPDDAPDDEDGEPDTREDEEPDAAPDAGQEPDAAAMRAWLDAQGDDVQAEYQERLDRLRRAGLDADGSTALRTTFRSRHPILPDALKPVLSERD